MNSGLSLVEAPSQDSFIGSSPWLAKTTPDWRSEGRNRGDTSAAVQKETMGPILVVLNDPPYGTERSYNGLRLATSLAKRGEVNLRLFLIGDAAACAKAGQKVPSGYYNVETMLKVLVGQGVPVEVCGTCMDARGIAEADLVGGAHRSSMDELTDWTRDAAKVILF
jgi:uncharacterized protein involved in oxidation of intracellular sulfur